MPTNLYGPGDNYHPEYSHVVAALIRRFHEAKLAGAPNVVVWGTGTPRKLLDVSRLTALDWRARTSLGDGIALAYRAYLNENREAAE